VQLLLTIQGLDHLVQTSLEVLLSLFHFGQVLVMQTLRVLGFRLLRLEGVNLGGQIINPGMQCHFVFGSLGGNLYTRIANDYMKDAQ
jgi:hypothetical protein